MMADRKAATSTAHGTRIEPLTRLATGGMADIWLARELGAAGLERFVVVKRLLPHLACEPEIVDMFVAEARFVARLVHPNVVQIHELGEDEQGYFLVMEYVAGCSVRELTAAAAKAGQKLPPHVAVAIIEQACRGAHAAHELEDADGRPLGLVHRDLSPHNLMIGPGGDVKVLDFGIAKATEKADATRAGSLKGKQGYMSPEQCLSAQVDRRSDIFTLGIVCWELLTGERLFQRETDFLTMRAIEEAETRLPSEVRPELPRAFDAVVAKALERELEARWRTADEFRRALIKAAQESGVAFSRDALAETLQQLLADKLEQREQALRGAASVTAHPDPSELRHVLTRSEPSMNAPAERTSGTGSDDVATVAQRRGVGAALSPLDEAMTVDEGGPSPLREPELPLEEVTLLERRRAEPAPARADEAPPTQTSPKAPTPRLAWMLLLLLLLVGAGGSVVWLVHRAQATATAPLRAPSATAAAPRPPSGPTLRLVVAPTVKPEVLRRELAPFLGWLGRSLDRPVELTIADSYEHSAELVTSGRAELGLLPPLLVVSTMARTPRLQLVAVRLYDGSRVSDGYLLVRDDAPIASAADLKGRAVCYVDRTSTTGFLLPRIWMRKAGLDPDKDVRIVISGDHLAAMRDLASGRCDAAAVYSGAYLSARKEGIAVGKLRLLAVTGQVPQDTLVAGPDVPAADVKRVRDAVLSFSPQRDIDAGEVGEVLGISGFAAFDPAELDTIREAAQQEGLVPKAAGQR